MKKYEQISQIGRGSFGVVYKCRLRKTGQFVALKVISTYAKTEDDLNQIKKEIEIQKQIHHPNIIKFYESFEEDNNIVIVTELAQTDLYEICKISPLSIQTIQQVAYEITSVLAVLHKNRICHRDIKPQNCLITSSGECKLCDFGFAKQLSAQTLNLQSLKGSPVYLAPEIAKNQNYDFKSDIWSLGIMLFELSTGTAPFIAKDFVQLIQMLQSDSLMIPFEKYQIFQDYPLLRQFIEHCLRKNPERRYSADQLLNLPFLNSNDPNLIIVKNMSKINIDRDWFSEKNIIIAEPQKVKVSLERSYHFEDDEEIFANVQYSSQWLNDANSLLSDLCKEFQLFQIIVDMMANIDKIDSIFQSSVIINSCQTSKYDLVDYDNLNSLKGQEYKQLKMEFIIYLLMQQKQFYFKLIVSFANYRNQQLNKQQIIFNIILCRVLAMMFGQRPFFNIPIIYGQNVAFPFDIIYQNECMQIPINQNEQFKFVGNISAQSNMIQHLAKEKHLVDALEILICFIQNVDIGSNKEDDLFAYKYYFQLVLVSTVQSLLSMGQLLYLQYVPYLKSENQIIQSASNQGTKREINYNFNILDIQKELLPEMGKMKMPEFCNFIDQNDNGKFYFQNLDIPQDRTEFIINIIVKFIFHYHDHIPKLSSLLFEQTKKLYSLSDSQSMYNGMQQIFETFTEAKLSALYSNDSTIDEQNLIKAVIEVMKNVFAGLPEKQNYNMLTRILMLTFLKTIFNMVLDYQVMLPLLIIRQYPIPPLLNQRRFFLVEEQQEYDFVADIDQLLNTYRKMYQLQNAINDGSKNSVLIKNIINNQRALFTTVFSCIPFLYLQRDESQINLQDEEKCIKQATSFHRFNQEYQTISILLLTQIICPDIISLLPHCFHLQKDKFPNVWYSEYIKKICQEKQFLISEDNIQTDYLKTMCVELQKRELPRRGHQLIMQAPLISCLENMKNLNLPQSSKFKRNSICGNTAYFLVKTILNCNLTKARTFQFLVSQTMINGLLYYEQEQYKLFSKFLTVSINMHSSVDLLTVLQDFLYQGAPYTCLVENNDQIDDLAYEAYQQNSETRVKYYQLLQFIVVNDVQHSQELIEMKFEDQDFSISFLSILISQILWLTASNREEECKIVLLLTLFRNCPTLAFKILEEDMKEIKLLMQQDTLTNNLLLQYLVSRIIVFIKAQTELFLNMNYCFQYELNYNLKFIEDLKRGEIFNSDQELFELPRYQLNSGSRILLPLANSLDDEDIQMNIIIACIDFVSTLLKNNFSLGQNQIDTITLALSKLLDYFIIQKPNFASITILPYSQGFLDPVYQYLSQISIESSGYLELLNKLLIISCLALDNSVAASAQAAFSPPIHSNIKSSQYQLVCGLKQCPTCSYNVNNCCYQGNKVFEMIERIDAIQHNRNYSFVYYHWGFLWSPLIIPNLCKIVENLIVFYKQKQQCVSYCYSTDLQHNLAISELIRLLCVTTSKQFVSSQLCMPDNLNGGLLNTENQFLQIAKTLYASNILFGSQLEQQMLYALFLLEYDIPESFLHSISFFTQPKSMQFAFSLIFRQFQISPEISHLFANQFAFSGALLSDYKNELLNISTNSPKYQCINEYLGIISQIARSDQFYSKYLKSLINQQQIRQLFDFPAIQPFLFNLAASLSHFDDTHQQNIQFCFEIAGRILKQQTIDKLVVLQIFCFFSKAGKFSVSSKQIIQYIQVFKKYALSSFDDLELRYSAFLVLCVCSKWHKNEILKVNIGQIALELLGTIDNIKPSNFTFFEGLNWLKMAAINDEEVINIIKLKFDIGNGANNNIILNMLIGQQ